MTGEQKMYVWIVAIVCLLLFAAGALQLAGDVWGRCP
jgi:hypothetical protein